MPLIPLFVMGAQNYLEHKLLHRTLWDMATEKEIRPDVVAKISKAQLEEIKEAELGNGLWPPCWETGCFMAGNMCVIALGVNITDASSKMIVSVGRLSVFKVLEIRKFITKCSRDKNINIYGYIHSRG